MNNPFPSILPNINFDIKCQEMEYLNDSIISESETIHCLIILQNDIYRESIENNDVAEDNLEASMPKTLARLFQKAFRAEARLRKQSKKKFRVGIAMGRHMKKGGFTKDTLRKKTQVVVKIF
ncbi:6092_t:CDS:2 [Funneliformis mosseae]|uniref:6092_t:CDS:1 n=1 Tax=Funneliformis mosseae TaxID=27381 RepID=A0A9N8Z270_FUNMO|nr:6092_t:CDS:2 [Funneliformis mosseae]